MVTQMSIGQRIDRVLARLEWRWSLSNFLLGTYLSLSTALPAWAVSAMSIFDQYAPLSWVLAGFAGLATAVVLYAIFAWAYGRVIRSQYDRSLYERTGFVDPMAKTFENRRIFLADFILPSAPHLAEKAFINCEIIGPANLLLRGGNSIATQRLPYCDGLVIPSSTKNYYNFLIVDNCSFRDCSFKRCTVAITDMEYESFGKTIDFVNWLNPPDQQLELISSDDLDGRANSGSLPSPPPQPDTEAEAQR
jgi:hypothetical protein